MRLFPMSTATSDAKGDSLKGTIREKCDFRENMGWNNPAIQAVHKTGNESLSDKNGESLGEDRTSVEIVIIMEFDQNTIHPPGAEEYHVEIAFLGANRQVTGSRHLLRTGTRNIMVDCGMFQERDFLGRNWETSPVPPRDVDDILVTHAHLDHCGLLPRLVKGGVRRPHLLYRGLERVDRDHPSRFGQDSG